MLALAIEIDVPCRGTNRRSVGQTEQEVGKRVTGRAETCAAAVRSKDACIIDNKRPAARTGDQVNGPRQQEVGSCLDGMGTMAPGNRIGDLIMTIPAILAKVSCAPHGGVAANCRIRKAEVIGVIGLGEVGSAGQTGIGRANGRIVLLDARLLQTLVAES